MAVPTCRYCGPCRISQKPGRTLGTVTCIWLPGAYSMMAGGGEVRFRAMTREEVAVAVAWAGNEGWNPGRSDADCFRHADPEGFFCAECGGSIIGTVSVVNYDERFAFWGLFIVDPAYRARGIGMDLYRYAMRHAGSRVVGCDGVVAMVETYQRNGGLFQHYNNVRYEGTGGGTDPGGLTPLSAIGFDRLADYDAAHFPARRERFLRCWIGAPGHYGLARLDNDGTILGYGVRRPCRSGHKIGPLFARDRATAELILDGLVAGIPGEPFYLDIPVPNADAVALAQDRGMAPVFSTARLYTTPDPLPLPLDEIFGVTTFELG
jgi:GNAT superfamily N-acetyltransferase